MVITESLGNWNNQEIKRFTLGNANGFKVTILNLGAAVQTIMAPDRNGRFEDVVLGFDDFQSYTSDNSYIGVVCGRFANRIAGSSFTIGQKNFQIGQNEGRNTLHGGLSGFNRKVWNASILPEYMGPGVILQYNSPNGEEGFPGNLKVTVVYLVGIDNSLQIKYLAETDESTYINLTNHAYFNLSGCARNVLDHTLFLNASAITEVDKENIPSGKLLQVKHTAWDFTSPKPVGQDASSAGGGYDHNFVLNEPDFSKPAACVMDPESGRLLECFTSEPAIQLYTANHFDGSQIGKGGIAYKKHYGLCLEAQHFPDSMHHPAFPSTLLNPGKPYSQDTIYRFSIA